MKLLLSAVLLVLSLAVPAALAADAPTDFVVGKKLSIDSAILGEKRPLQIFVPGDYESAADSYPVLPVLYLLDGPDHFIHVSGMIDYLARKGRIPPMIIVAIANTNRTRDLTPTHTDLAYDGKPDEAMAVSGGGEKFFSFLHDELIPYVEKNYRAAPFRILHGHSFGGLTAIAILKAHPETFHAIMAISPSLWWDQQVLLKDKGPVGRPGQFLFLCVGNERAVHEQSIDQYARSLRTRAVSGMQWTYKSYPDETHGSVPHQSLYDALKFLYPDWDYIGDRTKETPVSYDGLTAHYQELSARYGYSIKIPQSALSGLVGRLNLQDKSPEALAVAERAVAQYPKSVPAQLALAAGYKKAGNAAEAKKAYTRALELDPTSATAKKELDKLAR